MAENDKLRISLRWITLCFVLILEFHNLDFGDCRHVACTAENHRFQCKNGYCTMLSFKCDGEDDCRDNSDEMNCTRDCNVTSEFACANRLCIQKSWVCDGTDDCKDNSDEAPSLCGNRTCGSDELACDDKCIPPSWKCDGEKDCTDGRDEIGCPKPTCPSTEFQCDDGECIEKQWVCDGEIDCDGGTDEQNCPPKDCKAGEIKCDTTQQCIQKSWKCDNATDCDDGSDEKHCDKLSRSCPPLHFVCASGHIQCVLSSWVCDGGSDCSDGSDERNCNKSIVDCTEQEFACDSSRCISLSQACDGQKDCADGSDEHNCPDSSCNSSTSFQCPNGKCILRSQLCDRRNDCPGGEDEERGPGKCFENECIKGNGNCSQTCIDLSYGYKCECSKGYKLTDDGRLCDDVDECVMEPSPCDQACTNTKGSFKCSCRDNYVLDNGRCKPETEDNSMSLVFSDRATIRRIHLERGHYMSVVASRLKYAVGVALHVRNRSVFWTDASEGTIASMSMTSTNSTKSWKAGRSPLGLAMDWVHQHLYWIDVSHETVSVSRLDGTWSRTLTTLKRMEPRFIAVHPDKGYMYVSTNGPGNTAIIRFGMDGGAMTKVVSSDIRKPTGLTIDYVDDLIYWVDAKRHVLASCDLNGKNRRIVLQQYNDLQQPCGIAVFSQRVYWTDKKSHSLRSCDKRDGSKLKVIDARLHAPMDIRVDHPETQPEMKNHCENHTCQYLCLPMAIDVLTEKVQYSCACPDGFVKAKNNSSRCVTVVRPAKTLPTTTSISELNLSTAYAPTTAPPVLTLDTRTDTGKNLVIAICVIALIVLLGIVGFMLVRWHRRRSQQLSMNFDNPVYRKTTTPHVPESNGLAHFMSMARTESQVRLVGAEEDVSRERTDSVGSDVSAGHVYHQIGEVPADDTTSQLSVNFPTDQEMLVT